MKINIAVVGCGHWGKNLVRNFAELESLYAVCDPNTALAQKFAEQYSVKNLSFEEINDDASIEGIVLAVPAPLHASMAIEAMSAGKHVYVEKPLAMNPVEGQRMIDVSNDKGVHLMVGHLLQYHTAFEVVRDLVEAGELGKLNYIYSNRLSLGKIRSEENVVWSFAPHDISMILSLIGQEPKTVNTVHSCVLQDGIADIATIHMEFEDEIKAHVAVSWLHPFKEQKLVVIGSSAMVVFDDTEIWEKKLALYRHKVNFSDRIAEAVKSEVTYLDVPHVEPLKQECQYFIDLIAQRRPPLTDGREALRVLRVLAAASVSMENT